MSWNQSNCVKCGVPVYEVRSRQRGSEFTYRKRQATITVLYNVTGEWRRTLRDDNNGRLEEVDVQVYHKHYCLESDLNRQSVIRARYDRSMFEFPKDTPTFIGAVEFNEKREYITGAFQYPCPRCEQPVGEQCRNLSYKRGLKLNRRAHDERGFFALEQRGYKCWFDSDENLWKIWYVGS